MWIQRFVDYLRFERTFSEKTIAGYQADLEEFERFCKALDSELTWTSVDADVVRDWVVSQMDRGNAAASVCRRLSALRSFYRFLLSRKMVDADPVRTVRGPRKERALPHYVREADMNRLLDGWSYFPDDFEGERDRLILLMFYSTGVRLSELVGLNLSCIDKEQMQIKVTGKRDKQRLVPYGDELGDAIRSYLAARTAFLTEKGISAQEAVFLNTKTAGRISSQGVRAIVQKYLSMVTTLRKKSPHVLRHTFATTMLNHHADLQSVKELLGHESLSTTEIYTHTSFEELKEMYKQAHPRAK